MRNGLDGDHDPNRLSLTAVDTHILEKVNAAKADNYCRNKHCSCQSQFCRYPISVKGAS